MKTLTVFCPLGLSNRLRVLLSGLALAEASGRHFRMLWPKAAACAAPFETLFTNHWPVATVSSEAVAGLPYIPGWFGHLPDLLSATEVDLVVGHPGWLIRPGQFAGHEALAARCQSLFGEMQPVAAIREAIAAFKQTQFRPTMIGVHLRRGDLLRDRPDVAANTAQAIHAINAFLARFPDAGILLCTDDGAVDQDTGRIQTEDVRARLRTQYGARVVWTTPRSLDRRTSEAIQDALLDLWLLRDTDCVVGTTGSSFSELACYGRNIPHTLVWGATARYQPIERLARISGLYTGLRILGRWHFGRNVPFPQLLEYYRRAPYRWMSRAAYRVSPALHRQLRRRFRERHR